MTTWLVEAVASPARKGSVPHSPGKASGAGLVVATGFSPDSRPPEKARAARCM